ncbi:MAG: hypothetical protein P8P74_14115 [Crocinitomicaceae bacterium]|nr:hypothetical protein [Crocinitomicaceae bacterium]
MKTFFTLLTTVLLINSSSFAQSINKTDPQQFWDTNIQAIVNGDVDEVVSQSHFPMTTFEGEWSKKDFTDAYEILFDETAIAELSSQTYRSIQPLEDGPNNVIYVVVITTVTEFDGEVFESSTILSFQKYEGEWKLYQIDMAG